MVKKIQDPLSVKLMLNEQLEAARETLTEAQGKLEEATLIQIEKMSEVDAAKRTVSALEIAIAHLEGKQAPETVAPISAETAAQEEPDDAAPISAERARQLAESRERLEERTAPGPECPGCKRRGTLTQMTHPSGITFTQCVKCGNQFGW